MKKKGQLLFLFEFDDFSLTKNMDSPHDLLTEPALTAVDVSLGICCHEIVLGTRLPYLVGLVDFKG